VPLHGSLHMLRRRLADAPTSFASWLPRSAPGSHLIVGRPGVTPQDLRLTCTDVRGAERAGPRPLTFSARDRAAGRACWRGHPAASASLTWPDAPIRIAETLADVLYTSGLRCGSPAPLSLDCHFLYRTSIRKSVRSSRLGVTCPDGEWLAGRSQVKRALPTLSGCCRSGSGG